MPRTVRWKLHTASSPERVFDLWSTDAGRARFWAERSTAAADGFTLVFPDGTVEHCRLFQVEPTRLFEFTYFGSTVNLTFEADGAGGTDVCLINEGVPDEEFAEVHAGWVSVLLAMKAAADFGIDLRNHDGKRTWRDGYVDQ